MLGSRTIFATIYLSKDFDSVWLPVLFHKLISAGLPPYLGRRTQSFLLIGTLAWFIKITKVTYFQAIEIFRKNPSCTFISSSVIFLLFCISCSLYADNMAIRSSSSSVPTAMKVTQGALIRLEWWSAYWCLPLNPSKCEAFFFSVDPHQANLHPIFVCLIPSRTFLEVTFDRTLFFSKHVSLLKAKFFSRLKALRCISASSWGPSKESLSLLHKRCISALSWGPSKYSLTLLHKPFLYFSFIVLLNGFLFKALLTFPSWNVFTERPVALSPATSRPRVFHSSSLRRLYLLYEPFWLISSCHLMSGLFVSQSLFQFQVCPSLK